MSESERRVREDSFVQRSTVDGPSMALQVWWCIVEKQLIPFANIITKDEHKQKELLDEARIRLWRADGSRYDMSNKDDISWVVTILRHRMWDLWRKKYPVYLVPEEVRVPLSVKSDERLSAQLAELEERKVKRAAERQKAVEDMNRIAAKIRADVEALRPVVERPKWWKFRR